MRCATFRKIKNAMCEKMKIRVFLEKSTFLADLALKMCECATCATIYTHHICVCVYIPRKTSRAYEVCKNLRTFRTSQKKSLQSQ